MSKYNLMDIFEQYQIGSGWTKDFDYDGMLNAGLKIETDTPVEVMKKVVEDFTDVNYHREASHLYGAIEALEAGDVFDANGKLNDFRHEIKNTMAKQGMDMSDDLGAYMASKMELDEGDAVDLAIEASQEKAGIKENEDQLKIAQDAFDKAEQDGDIRKQELALAAIELIKEKARIREDNCEKHDYKQIDPDGTAECTKCGLRNSDPSKTGEKVRSEGKGVDFIRALKVDANGTSLEIKSYLESLKRSGDKFDSVDDYVEDFKNYVADKALQEHFSRFMKDYQ